MRKKWTDKTKAIEVAKTIGCDITTQKAKTVATVKREFGKLVTDALEKQGCIENVFGKNTLVLRK